MAKCPKVNNNTHVTQRKCRDTGQVHKCKTVNCVRETWYCKTCRTTFYLWSCEANK